MLIRSEIVQKVKNIRCVISDIDGVLTNGILYLTTEGSELRAFHVHDGVGLKLLLCAGIEVAIITTTNNHIIDKRMEQLGIRHYFKGQLNKQRAFDTLQNQLNLSHESFAYIGDDLPDIPLIKQVGFGVAVANAVDEVKAAAQWQTQKPGGAGAVRELCDLILKTQNQFDLALDKYLND